MDLITFSLKFITDILLEFIYSTPEQTWVISWNILAKPQWFSVASLLSFQTRFSKLIFHIFSLVLRRCHSSVDH